VLGSVTPLNIPPAGMYRDMQRNVYCRILTYMIKEELFYLGVKALICNGRGEVLVLRATRRNGEAYYDLPGGRVNRNEDTSSALAREVKEETGITALKIGKHLGMALTSIRIPISDGEEGSLILSVYQCTAGYLTDLATEEGVELEWCPAVQLLERIQYPDVLADAITAELSPHNSTSR